MNKLLHTQFILLGLLLFFSCIKKDSNAQLISLENWTFRQAGTRTWYPAEVPGNVHTDLMTNGLIPNPFIGTNELNVQWVENEDWEYIAEFHINQESLGHDKIEITFEGLDTYAEIFLNDSLILQADNMFIPWSVNVKKYLRFGKNNLRVYFHSPVIRGQKKLDANPRFIPASQKSELRCTPAASPSGNASYRLVRQPACAHSCAMPAPIVPAPITATRSTAIQSPPSRPHDARAAWNRRCRGTSCSRKQVNGAMSLSNSIAEM